MVFSDDVVVVLHNICCGCVCIDKGDILMPREIRVVCCRVLAVWSGGEDDVFCGYNVVFVVVLGIVVVVVSLVVVMVVLIVWKGAADFA